MEVYLILCLLVFPGYPGIGYVRNRLFVRHIKFMETLLGGDFRYRFPFFLLSVLEVTGTYRGKEARYATKVRGPFRYHYLTLGCSRSLPQKRFMCTYSRVGEVSGGSVWRVGDTLQHTWHTFSLSASKHPNRTQIEERLDALLRLSLVGEATGDRNVEESKP